MTELHIERLVMLLIEQIYAVLDNILRLIGKQNKMQSGVKIIDHRNIHKKTYPIANLAHKKSIWHLPIATAVNAVFFVITFEPYLTSFNLVDKDKGSMG